MTRLWAWDGVSAPHSASRDMLEFETRNVRRRNLDRDLNRAALEGWRPYAITWRSIGWRRVTFVRTTQMGDRQNARTTR